MNRIIRMLTITGLGAFAGVTIGAGPAMAATNTGQAAVTSSTAGATAKPGDRVAGYYDSRTECTIAGRIGDHLGRWDDWHCYPVDNGWHDGDWALVVDYGWHDGGLFGHNRHGGPFDHHQHGGPFGHNQHSGFPFDNNRLRGGPVRDQHQAVKGLTGNNVGMPTAKPSTD